jgi:hypothetical protein
MPNQVPDPYPWRFEVCKECGRKNVVGFRVTDAMWDRIMGAGDQRVLCIWCFDERAAEKGIDWTEEPIEFYPVSTIAARKWAHIEDVTPRD